MNLVFCKFALEKREIKSIFRHNIGEVDQCTMLLEGRGASYKMPSKYVHIKYCWVGNRVKKEYKQIFIFSHFEEIFVTGE